MRSLVNDLICPTHNVQLIKQQQIYGKWWKCPQCDVVGKKAEGKYELTDQGLRTLRREGHRLAEKLWGEWAVADKKSMYRWMKENTETGHFSNMDDRQALEAVEKLKKLTMTKLTLTYVRREEKTSAKTNKPFTSLNIKAKEYGEKYLSGFGNKDNAGWAIGQTVEVAEVIEKAAANGKFYLNFEMPKKSDSGTEIARLDTRIDEMERKFEKMREAMTPIYNEWEARNKVPLKVPGTNVDYPLERNDVDFDPKDLNYPDESEMQHEVNSF